MFPGIGGGGGGGGGGGDGQTPRPRNLWLWHWYGSDIDTCVLVSISCSMSFIGLFGNYPCLWSGDGCRERYMKMRVSRQQLPSPVKSFAGPHTRLQWCVPSDWLILCRNFYRMCLSHVSSSPCPFVSAAVGSVQTSAVVNTSERECLVTRGWVGG